MELTQEQIKFLNKTVERGTWTLNSKGKVDVDGDVNMCFDNYFNIPVKFGKITGYLDCSYNNLTSLKNSPSYVGTGFICVNNQLTSLKFAPSFVGEDFWIRGNNLKNYFKNVKYKDFKNWRKLDWFDIIEEYPFLINFIVGNKILNKDSVISLINTSPRTKLYLK